MRSCLRGSDTIARLGVGEFTIILKNISNTNAVMTVVEKIQDCLSDPFRVDGEEFGITASHEISLIPQDGTSPEVPLKLAGKAIYNGNQGDKDQYGFFSQSGGVSVPDSSEGIMSNLELYTPRSAGALFYELVARSRSWVCFSSVRGSERDRDGHIFEDQDFNIVIVLADGHMQLRFSIHLLD